MIDSKSTMMPRVIIPEPGCYIDKHVTINIPVKKIMQQQIDSQDGETYWLITEIEIPKIGRPIFISSRILSEAEYADEFDEFPAYKFVSGKNVMGIGASQEQVDEIPELLEDFEEEIIRKADLSMSLVSKYRGDT